MLKRIYCEKFGPVIPNKTIEFGQGLNVVLGHDDKINSIGKSTVLLIVDFCFGGGTYAKKGSDVIANLGHHEIFFDFEFNGIEYHFARGTEEPRVYFECDLDRNKIGEPKKIDELTGFLKLKYFGKSVQSTFRSLVSRFSRINGKDNYDVAKPLKSNSNYSKSQDDVSVLEDLFGFLSVVAERKNEIKKLVEKLKSLRKAITSDWLKGMTKKEYEDAKREMESLKTDVDKVKLSVSDDAEAIESGVDPRALELKSQVNYLSRKRGALNARRSKIESLSDNQEMTDADLDALRSFFPECELRDLSIVAEYRKQLIINVNAEAKEEIERIDSELSRIAAELERYKELLAEMKISPTVTKAKLEECIDKSGRLKALSARTARYEEKERLTASKKDLESKLAEDEKRYISQIEVSLNEELARLNRGLYSIERIPPTIKLESNKYDYKTVNDSGTGTLYKSLLIFDLALLNLTCLPFVIHDSLLFSDIWTEPVKGLFDIYALQRKQIFVSFDGANAQQETVKEIIGKSIKVKLGGGEESLFGWSWATK